MNGVNCHICPRPYQEIMRLSYTEWQDTETWKFIIKNQILERNKIPYSDIQFWSIMKNFYASIFIHEISELGLRWMPDLEWANLASARLGWPGNKLHEIGYNIKFLCLLSFIFRVQRRERDLEGVKGKGKNCTGVPLTSRAVPLDWSHFSCFVSILFYLLVVWVKVDRNIIL